MNSFILVFLVLNIRSIYSTNQHPGHLKPFGSVGTLINIKELDYEFPSVVKLVSQYIRNSEPIISRRVLKNDKYYSIWQSNEQLLSQVYGLSDTFIPVESFKSNQRQTVQMTFEEFLQRFSKEPLLYANSVLPVLQKHLIVLKPLQCDLILDNLQSAILVINGINASPLMFAEDHDQFHCILRGRKRIILVNTLHYPDVRTTILPSKGRQRGPSINPDKMDLDQYPAFADVEYHAANLKAGDCLFIPSSWVFQERSFESTMSIVYNIKHQQILSVNTDQLQDCPTYDATFTLDQVDWPSEPKSFRDLITNLVNAKTKGFNKWQELFSKHLSYDLSKDSETSGLFEEFFDSIDVNGDGEITQNEYKQIQGVHQHHITDILYEIVNVINKRRKTNETKSQEHIRKQSTDNNYSDENSHVDNQKTEL